MNHKLESCLNKQLEAELEDREVRQWRPARIRHGGHTQVVDRRHSLRMFMTQPALAQDGCQLGSVHPMLDCRP